MRIKNQLVTSTHYWTGTNRKTSITVHETANTNPGANAQAHANLQANGNVRQASWHVQVDDREAIRSFTDDMRVWHAGRAAQDSLSLEICVNSDGDYDKALRNAQEVVKQWRAKHNLGRAAVVTHRYWTGKNCPTQLLASGDWEQFVAGTDPGGTPSSSSTPKNKGNTTTRKTTAQLAREVIDGKHGTGEARKRALGSRYNAVQAEVNRILTGNSSTRKTTAQLAREVIDGKHGTGEARKRALGNRYNAVQREVNRILGASTGGSRKTTAQLAREVIDGKHGDGEARKRALGSRYNAVQREVNRLLG